jgi:predicted transcriptional regulator
MLEHFFGSKTRVKLLQIFFRSPERPFYVRELSRLADIQLNAIRRELANLTAIGIIGLREEQVVSQKGLERSKYYQLQKESILFTELQALLTKSQLLEQKVFIDEVLHKAGQIKLFLLSGLFTQD